MKLQSGVGFNPSVLVAESLDESGMAILREGGLEVCEAAELSREEFESRLPDAQALIVRSKTKVTRTMLGMASSLQVIGRAGVGVDSIDVQAATNAGILVLNTPDASTIATAEHTLAMLLGLCRRISAGQERIDNQHWSAQDLTGIELAGKTLGIVGLGRIGATVATRARAFAMTVLAHDAVVSAARADSLGVKLVPLDELLTRADFVTLHTPLTAQTENLIGARELGLMKPTSSIINCARGGLIDEGALLLALESGAHRRRRARCRRRGATQVRGTWALLHHPRVVATPHLGGSTKEAQEKIARDLCRDVVAVLRGRPPSSAVNAPVNVPQEIRPFAELAHRLGSIFPQICDEKSLSRFDIMLEGELAGYEGLPFAVSFLVGLLPHLTEDRVSAVNALELARRLGVLVETLGAPCERGFAKALAVSGGRNGLAGTVVHGEQLRLIDIDGFELDAVLQGHLLLTRHHDVPGIIGKVGTILGEAHINIFTMEVARSERGDAILLAAVDRVPDTEILRRLRDIEDVQSVRHVEL